MNSSLERQVPKNAAFLEKLKKMECFMNLSEQGAYNQICKEDCLNIDFLAAVARFNFYLSKLKITIAAVRLIQIYLCKLVFYV